MSKQFQVEANGTIFGAYTADSEQAARDLCAADAGYKSEADMVEQLEQPSELTATEIVSKIARFFIADTISGCAAVTESEAKAHPDYRDDLPFGDADRLLSAMSQDEEIAFGVTEEVYAKVDEVYGIK